MSKTQDQYYTQFRKAGYLPIQALRASKTLLQWAELEDQDLVRLSAEPEQENYFDVYGEPDGYEDGNGRHVSAEQERKELEREIELNGCWVVYSEYRATPDDLWEHADSIDMCTGYRDPLSPFENDYVIDLMQAAVDAVEAQALAPSL
jgi:hypothetical protein